MNCASVLESLLDAELSDIAGQGNSALAEHLRSCVRCRRLAGQLLVDTRLLALAMPAAVMSTRVSRRTRYAALAPAGVVAALMIVTISRSPRQADAPATTRAQVVPDTTSVATVSTVIPPTLNRTPVVRSARPRATAGAMRAFQRPVAVAPVRMESSMRSSTTPVTTSSVVSVDPPAGVRATILHTSNPKLVVVWLY